MTSNKAIVLLGNVSEGYKAYGPFADFDLASEWADTQNSMSWIMTLNSGTDDGYLNKPFQTYVEKWFLKKKIDQRTRYVLRRWAGDKGIAYVLGEIQNRRILGARGVGVLTMKMLINMWKEEFGYDPTGENHI